MSSKLGSWRRAAGIAVFLMSGSAVWAQKFAPAPPPPDGKALVYVYRRGSMVGAAGFDRIYVNDNFLAALHNSNYALATVTPGAVVLDGLPRMKVIPGAVLEAAITNTQKKKYEKLRFDAEAGKIYYVKWYVTGSGGKMKIVDEETGTKEIKGLNLAKEN